MAHSLPDVKLAKLRQAFAEIDADGDGNITEEEFIKACLANEEFLYLLGPSQSEIRNSAVLPDALCPKSPLSSLKNRQNRHLP